MTRQLRRFRKLALCLTLLACGPQMFAQQGGALKVIKVEGRAPGPAASDGILANRTLYVSGQSGRTSQSNLPQDFRQQVQQSLANVQGVLRAAGMDFGNVVSMNVYLTISTISPP